MRVSRVVILAALLHGCVSALPAGVVGDVNRNLTVAALRRNPEAGVGQRVIVGGEILATRPRPGLTEIELLTRPLRYDDVPDRTDASDGRVLVHTTEFLDPAVYARDRQVTVVGAVSGAEERPVGDVNYKYPIVTAQHIRLWPPPSPALYPYPYDGFPWGLYGYRIHPYWPVRPPWPYYWW
jgi:outer membrane lipoprotein